jgi:hypothetical protein
LTILQRRYATGEITKEQYLDMKKELITGATEKPEKKTKKGKKKTSKRKK